MPIFDSKPRSWDAYLAGIGASGALMASASVLFVILVGVVTFSTWPHTGSLLGVGGGGEVGLQEAATPPPVQGAAPPRGLNLVKLLGRGAGPVPSGSARLHGSRTGGAGLNLGEGGVPQGGSGGSGSGQPQGAQPPPPSDSSQSNVVSRAVSGVGNTVQSDTNSLGDTLGGSSSPGLGGVVGGLGQTLNNTLQGLAGKR